MHAKKGLISPTGPNSTKSGRTETCKTLLASDLRFLDLFFSSQKESNACFTKFGQINDRRMCMVSYYFICSKQMSLLTFDEKVQVIDYKMKGGGGILIFMRERNEFIQFKVQYQEIHRLA